MPVIFLGGTYEIESQSQSIQGMLMRCYECARVGVEAVAVGLCRYCLIGLCLAHLADVTVPQYPVPKYTCHHRVATRGQAEQDPEGRR